MELKKLLNKGEVIFEFGLTDSYCMYTYIGTLESDDIAAALEDTLHRILDAGGTYEDVQEIMGAEVPDEERYEEMEADYTEIDLGYVIPGQITYVKPIE